MRKFKPKNKKIIQKKSNTKMGWIIVVLCWLSLAGVLAYLQQNSQAQTQNATIRTDPSSGTFTVGDEVDIRLRVNAATDYNFASVLVLYTSANMEYLGTTLSTDFNGNTAPDRRVVHTPSSPSGPYIEISNYRRSGTGGLRGTKTLAKMRFRITRTGTGKITLGFPSVQNRPLRVYNVQLTNGSYTLRAAAPTPPVDVCPNIAGTQTTVPSGYIKNSAGNCVRPTPTPTPTPRPTPKPTPTPTPAPRPAPTPPRPTAPIRPSSSTNTPVTQGSIRLTGLKIADIGYQTAKISWQTNQNSSTLVEYGTSKDNLSQSKSGSNTQNHQIDFVSADKLQAGTTYYIKVTSKNGNQTATATGEFTTKPVPVVISVTDTDNKPIADASVTIGEVVGVSNEKGEVELTLPSGFQLISASKGDLYREVDAQILIPDSADTPKQRISLNLGTFNVEKEAEKAAEEAEEDSDGSAWVWLFFLLPLLFAAGIFFFLLMKRRKEAADEYIGGDILEAENYAPPMQPVLPSVSQTTPEVSPIQVPETQPTIASPASDVPQYASLPELVGRYASDQAVQNQPPNTSPAVSSPWAPKSDIPEHTSLKDLVSIPTVQQPTTPQLPENDLPISPLPIPSGIPTPGVDTPPLPPPIEPIDSSSEPKPIDESSDISDDQTSLTIEH